MEDEPTLPGGPTPATWFTCSQNLKTKLHMNTTAGREVAVDILAEKTVRQIGPSHLLDTWMMPRKQYEDVRFSSVLFLFVVYFTFTLESFVRGLLLV